MLSSQEMFAITEGAERERRVAKVGGWGTGEGSEFWSVLVSVDRMSESRGHDIGSWCTLDGVSRRMLAGVFCGKLEGESWGVQDVVSWGVSNAVPWGVQVGGSLDNIGKSLDGVLVSHGIEGELSLLGSTWSKGNPIAWQRASTCLTSISCWILSLMFSSCSFANASASGAAWAAASTRRASTRFPKACRSLWISPTAHRNVNSNFLLQNCSSLSSTASWASRSPITSSRPDSAQALSGLPKASGASEAGRKSRFTPGMARLNVTLGKVFLVWIHLSVQKI